jgi:hypothetical protein
MSHVRSAAMSYDACKRARACQDPLFTAAVTLDGLARPPARSRLETLSIGRPVPQSQRDSRGTMVLPSPRSRRRPSPHAGEGTDICAGAATVHPRLHFHHLVLTLAHRPERSRLMRIHSRWPRTQ